MKRDWSVIKHILSLIEEEQLLIFLITMREDIKGTPLNYNCDLESLNKRAIYLKHIDLMIDENLLKSPRKKPFYDNQFPSLDNFAPIRMTFKGYEFLDKLRQNKVPHVDVRVRWGEED